MTHSPSDFEPGDPRNEEQQSLGTLFSDLTQNVSVLVRQEIELAKTELKESASNAGQGAGMFAGAGIAAHFVLLFLSLAAWVGVAQWLGYGWAALIIAAIWAIMTPCSNGSSPGGGSNSTAITSRPWSFPTPRKAPMAGC